jgi:hypothetical protein
LNALYRHKFGKKLDSSQCMVDVDFSAALANSKYIGTLAVLGRLWGRDGSVSSRVCFSAI